EVGAVALHRQHHELAAVGDHAREDVVADVVRPRADDHLGDAELLVDEAALRRGAAATSFLIRASIRPAPSAAPAPIIAMKVTAITPKPAKLDTNDVKMKRMPSTSSSPWTEIVTSSSSNSSSSGYASGSMILAVVSS